MSVSHSCDPHAELRTVVETMDRGMSALSGDAADKSTANALRASWGELVKLLALGPAPEVRECPHCGEIGMRAATVCGRCWAKLSPPAAG